jgi:hypothetical protein
VGEGTREQAAGRQHESADVGRINGRHIRSPWWYGPRPTTITTEDLGFLLRQIVDLLAENKRLRQRTAPSAIEQGSATEPRQVNVIDPGDDLY